MIKTLATSIVLYTLAASFIANIMLSTDFAMSILIGGFTMLINVVGLALFWRLIFSKKLIALAMVIIIFKYLILAVVLWSLYNFKWINPLGFCIGLGSLMISIFVLLLTKQFLKKDI